MLKLALHWQILITMITGALGGVLISSFLGEQKTEFNSKSGAQYSIHDTLNSIEVTVSNGDSQVTYIVDPKAEAQAGQIVFGTAKQFEMKAPEVYKVYMNEGRSWARLLGELSHRVGGLFLRLLKMVSVPLIIVSLVTGVTGLGDAGRLGSMFGKTILYYLSTSMLAILTGLLLVNIVRPGVGAEVPPGLIEATDETQKEAPSLGEVLFDQLETMIPTNPFGAIAESNFLSIISFSLAFGVFTILVGGKTADTIRSLFGAAFEVMMRLTMAIIHLAPIGVFFLMLYATATQGLEVFRILGYYMIAVFLALCIHAFVTLPLIVKFIAKRSPLQFMKAMSPALLTAFSSASSNATLPLTLTSVEERGKVSNRVSSFVLPLGATVNMDGTALYEVIAVLFIAQVAGIELSVVQQIIIAFTALLASIGAAGIPHAGLVMMVIILQAVNLPTEMQGLIIAVDRILDMCRTAVNVWSDSCGCAVVARYTED